MQDRINESDESRSTSPAVAQKLKQKSHYYTQSSECEAKKKNASAEVVSVGNAQPLYYLSFISGK